MDHGHSTATDQDQSRQTGNLNRGVQIGIVTVDGNGNIRSGDAVYFQEETTIQKQLERYSEDNYGSSLGAQLVKAADICALADGYGVIASELTAVLGFNESLREDVVKLKAKLHEALTALGEAEDRERGMQSIELRTVRIGPHGETECLSEHGEIDLWPNAAKALKPAVGDCIAIIHKAVEPAKADPLEAWTKQHAAAMTEVCDAVNQAITGYGCALPEIKPAKLLWEHARDQVKAIRPDAAVEWIGPRLCIRATKLCGQPSDTERGAWVKARDMLADCGLIAM